MKPMRHLLMLSLPVMALGACVGPLEGLIDPETYEVTRDERMFAVRVHYDPLEFAYFTRVYEPDGYLSYGDRALAIDIVANSVGPQVCGEGEVLAFEPGQVWNAGARLDDNTSLGLSHYMEDIGEWRIVAECA